MAAQVALGLVVVSTASRVYHRSTYTLAKRRLRGDQTWNQCMQEMHNTGYTLGNTTLPTLARLISDSFLLYMAAPVMRSIVQDYVIPSMEYIQELVTATPARLKLLLDGALKHLHGLWQYLVSAEGLSTDLLTLRNTLQQWWFSILGALGITISDPSGSQTITWQDLLRRLAEPAAAVVSVVSGLVKRVAWVVWQVLSLLFDTVTSWTVAAGCVVVKWGVAAVKHDMQALLLQFGFIAWLLI